MRMKIVLGMVLGCGLAFGEEAGELPGVIAFGSCAQQSREQPIWEAVVAAKPGLFVFLGDNIYGDSDDVRVLEEKYKMLGEKPGYRKLLETCPVMATWDDHDYGRNDAGAEYPFKKESQRAFLDFFGVAKDSPRREREGVYDARVFEKGGKRLQVIVLDTRYFRSALVRLPEDAGRPRSAGPYGANEDAGATVLGEAQWVWLEEQLREPADLRIVGTSIQAIPEDHGWEKWGNFPRERARLFGLIKETGANGVVLLSGDRHMGEISVIPRDEAAGVGYPLYEVTSSVLNQGGGGAKDEPNRWRVAGTHYQGINFGLVRVDWEAEEPSVVMELCGLDGKVVGAAKVGLGELKVAAGG